MVLAAKAGIDVDGRPARPRPALGEVPFDSATQVHGHVPPADPSDPTRRAAVREGRARRPARPVRRPSSTATAPSARSTTSAGRGRSGRQRPRSAAQGLRVLAVATARAARRRRARRRRRGRRPRPLDRPSSPSRRSSASSTRPAPRPATPSRLCHSAGIGVKMITGDHATTAGAIAAELGIEGRVVTGDELDAHDRRGAGRADRRHRRVRPGVARAQGPGRRGAQGQRPRRGHDRRRRERRRRRCAGPTSAWPWASPAPRSPRKPATWCSPTTTSPPSSSAVERGRTIYDNIVKFVRFQLTTNMGAISTILGAALFGLPVPFTADPGAVGQHHRRRPAGHDPRRRPAPARRDGPHADPQRRADPHRPPHRPAGVPRRR